MILLNYFIVIIFHHIWIIQCYPYGAPASACNTMMPYHETFATPCESGYIIEASAYEYNSSNNILITVHGVTAANVFLGILLVAKDESSQSIVGTWSSNDSTLQTVYCDDTYPTAITQNSAVMKSQIQAVWTPPSQPMHANTIIKATIVRSHFVFYVDCFNISLKPQQTSIIQSTTTATINSQTVNNSINLKWTYLNGVTTVTIASSNLGNSQWLGIGLSLDDKMGNDHVFVCKRSRDDTIQVERYINPDGTLPPILVTNGSDMGGVFKVNRAVLEDKMITCEFTLSNFTSSTSRRRKRSITLLSQNTFYETLVAKGFLSSSNSLLQHFSTVVLSQLIKLDLSGEISTIPINEPNENKVILLQLHGIIMIFIWIIFVSTGIIMARYFRQSWPGKNICDKPTWFFTHRTIMLFSAVMTMVAFAFVVAYKGKIWPSSNQLSEFIHSLVGIFVIMAAVIQPFMSVFRCEPTHPRRFIFNYLHTVIGIGAFIGSAVAIFLAIRFIDMTSPINKPWRIPLAWLLAECFILVGFECVRIFTRNKRLQFNNQNRIDSINMNPVQDRGQLLTNDNQSVQGNNLKERVQTTLLALHILIAFGISLVLAYSVGKAF